MVVVGGAGTAVTVVGGAVVAVEIGSAGWAGRGAAPTTAPCGGVSDARPTPAKAPPTPEKRVTMTTTSETSMMTRTGGSLRWRPRGG
jgi:hypothetical protein